MIQKRLRKKNNNKKKNEKKNIIQILKSKTIVIKHPDPLFCLYGCVLTLTNYLYLYFYLIGQVSFHSVYIYGDQVKVAVFVLYPADCVVGVFFIERFSFHPVSSYTTVN